MHKTYRITNILTMQQDDAVLTFKCKHIWLKVLFELQKFCRLPHNDINLNNFSLSQTLPSQACWPSFQSSWSHQSHHPRHFTAFSKFQARSCLAFGRSGSLILIVYCYLKCTKADTAVFIPQVRWSCLWYWHGTTVQKFNFFISQMTKKS